MSARSPLFILKRISQQYSIQLLLRTENTYSSKLSNSSFLHKAIILNMCGGSSSSPSGCPSSTARGLTLTEKSTSSIAPGTRPGCPKITQFLFKITYEGFKESELDLGEVSGSCSSVSSLGIPSSFWNTSTSYSLSCDGSNLISSNNLQISYKLSDSIGLLFPESATFSGSGNSESAGGGDDNLLIFYFWHTVYKIIRLSLFCYFYWLDIMALLDNVIVNVDVLGLASNQDYIELLPMNKYNTTKYSIPHPKNYRLLRHQSMDEGEKGMKKNNLPNFVHTILIENKNQELEHHARRRGSMMSVKKRKGDRRVGTEGSRGKDEDCMDFNNQENRLEQKIIDVRLPQPRLKMNTIPQIPQINTFDPVSRTSPLKKQYTFKSTTSKKTPNRNTNLISQSQRSVSMTPSQKIHALKMQQLYSNFNEQRLYNRLSIYSKETLKSSLRVYKEDFQKIITQRYGRDRVTTFLDTEYIQDYNSMTKTIQLLCKYTSDEVLALVFLIMDQNADGLITPSDLINFIGASNPKIITNPLLMDDLCEIMKYIGAKQNSVADEGSLEYDLLAEEGVTIMKWRILKFQKNKKAKDKQGLNRRSKLINGRARDRFFTMRQQKIERSLPNPRRIQQNLKCVISFFLKNSKKPPNQPIQKAPIHFSINFQTFKQIFHQKIPRTFIDLIYLIGGIQIPTIRYIPIDSSVLIKNTMNKIEIQEERGLEKIKQMIREMKEFSSSSSYVYQTVIGQQFP